MPKSMFDSDIEKATSEYNVTEDWQLIMDLCDRIRAVTTGPKESLKLIMKRVNHPVPHVAMQALTLLTACVDNCGKPFHLEICSRDWTNEARSVISRGHQKVSEKLKELVEKWATDFKDDPQLNIMCQFYKKLKADGFSFDEPPATKAAAQSTKPKEDEINFKEDLELAIAMSLQETEQTNKTPSSSLYPSATSIASAPVSYQEQEHCKVRALYDFEAAEDNEMTFKTGEIFSVLDNSDENWWKGQNHRGVGLFPANFVTTDLSEVKQEMKKKVRFVDGENTTQTVQTQSTVLKQKTVINDEHLDLTLSMLKNASPNEIDDEEETICSMEETAKEMGTLIEKKILQCSHKKDDLNDLNEKYLQALSMYQQLMKEPRIVSQPPPSVYPPQATVQYHQDYPHPQFQPGQPQFHSPIGRSYSPQQPMNTQHAESVYIRDAGTAMLRQQPTSMPPQSTYQQAYSQQPSSLPPQGTLEYLPQPTFYSNQPASLPPMSYQQQQQQPCEPASLPYDYSQPNSQAGQMYAIEPFQSLQTEYTSLPYNYNQQQGYNQAVYQ